MPDEKWDIKHIKSCDLDISILVIPNWLEPPKDINERIGREEMKTYLNSQAYDYLSNKRNKHNLINAILGNKSFII